MSKVTHTVSTKKDKDSAAKDTNFTVDFTGCTEGMYQAMGMAYLTVKRQGAWRAKGIPANETIMAKDHVPGTRAVDNRSPEEKARDAILAMPESERIKFLQDAIRAAQPTKKAA